MWLFRVLGCSRKSSTEVKVEEVPTSPPLVPIPESSEASTLNDSGIANVPELEITLESEKENRKETTNIADMPSMLEEYLKPYLTKANLSSMHITPADEYWITLNKGYFKVPAKDFFLALHKIIRDNASKKPKYYGDYLIMFKSRKMFNKFKRDRQFESEFLLSYINVIYEKA